MVRAGGAPVRLTVSGLFVDRGGRPVLDNVGFSAAPGDAVVVTGRNGAGKTTLLRTLAGLLQPAAGVIRVEDVADPEAPLAEHAHLIGHREGLKDALTAAENLAFWRDLLGGRGGLAVETALASVNLAHALDLPARTLSAGQRRRLALARLLVAPRPLWLLDEPQTALDVQSQAMLGRLVAEHRARGGIVVVATHAELGWPAVTPLAIGAEVRA